MPNEIVIWDAVKNTGSFLNSVANFSSSVGSVISNYKKNRQLSKSDVRKIEILAKAEIEAMQRTADALRIAHQMDLIDKAIQKAYSASTSKAQNYCMEYVDQLHQKFMRDFL